MKRRNYVVTRKSFFEKENFFENLIWDFKPRELFFFAKLGFATKKPGLLETRGGSGMGFFRDPKSRDFGIFIPNLKIPGSRDFLGLRSIFRILANFLTLFDRNIIANHGDKQFR